MKLAVKMERLDVIAFAYLVFYVKIQISVMGRMSELCSKKNMEKYVWRIYNMDETL